MTPVQSSRPDSHPSCSASGSSWPAPDGRPLAEALEAARERGVVTSLDPLHDATGRWDRLHPALPNLDAICPNLTEARGITGRGALEFGGPEREPAA